MAKAAEVLTLLCRMVEAIEEHRVELVRPLDDQLWSLLDEYASLGVLDIKRRLDLLHYASATLLDCTHLASWDRRHFSSRIEKSVNQVNSSRALTTLKVGDPVTIARYLGIA